MALKLRVENMSFLRVCHKNYRIHICEDVMQIDVWMEVNINYQTVIYKIQCIQGINQIK
jgi:hypothetical protein